MKILLISNSFGVNLQTFAKKIAELNGFEIETYTLYIGGCSLDTHEKNIKENNESYELFVNGETTHEMISIAQALEREKWDIISLQQASHYSGILETYYPHFGFVYNFVKEKCPKAKIVFHQTWAYSPINSYKYEEVPNFCSMFKFKNAFEMKQGIDLCLNKIKNDFKLDAIINSGDVVDLATQGIGDCYDAYGFHMNELGCYLIGLNFIKILMNKELEKVFVPPCMGKETAEKCVKFINERF